MRPTMALRSRQASLPRDLPSQADAFSRGPSGGVMAGGGPGCVSERSAAAVVTLVNPS